MRLAIYTTPGQIGCRRSGSRRLKTTLQLHWCGAVAPLFRHGQADLLNPDPPQRPSLPALDAPTPVVALAPPVALLFRMPVVVVTGRRTSANKPLELRTPPAASLAAPGPALPPACPATLPLKRKHGVKAKQAINAQKVEVLDALAENNMSQTATVQFFNNKCNGNPD